MASLTKTTQYAILATVAAITAACQDNSEMGQSLVTDQVAVVVDSSFTITGHTILNDSVQSRTITQLLGCVDAPGYGLLRSDVVTQFMPAYALDTTGVKVENIDSLKLIMQMDLTAYTGDSIAPMGIEVYRLTRALQTPMYSSFPTAGYYDPTKPLASVIYNVSTANQPDSLVSNKVIQVETKLPVELGRELYRAYLDNPAIYASPTQFSDQIFKGLYLKNSYGSGRIIRVARTVMSMYFRRNTKTSAGNDTIVNGVGTYFAVTPEIITNNNISYTLSADLKKQIDNGAAIITAPAGTDVELKFPARQIIANYRAGVKNLGVINSLTLTINASPIDNKYTVAPPPHLLLILKNKKKEFFSKNKINDDRTSFYAVYNEASHTYTFTGMRQYLLDLMAKDEITDDDITFILTPVSISTETSGSSYYGDYSTVVTSITPFTSWPTMTKINLEKTKINLVYSTQTINNY